MGLLFPSIFLIVIVMCSTSLIAVDLNYKNGSNCTVLSRCGEISNVPYPFQIVSGPIQCADMGHTYNLLCENNEPIFYFELRRYVMRSLITVGDFDITIIRVADASVNKTDICSFPSYTTAQIQSPLNKSEVELEYPILLPSLKIVRLISVVHCPHPLKNNYSASYFNGGCAGTYVKAGSAIKASEIPENCTLDPISYTNWDFKDVNNATLSEIHEALIYGFELHVVNATPMPRIIDFSFTPQVLIPIGVAIVGLFCAVLFPPIIIITGSAAVVVLHHYSYELQQFRVLLIVWPQFLRPGHIIEVVTVSAILAPRILLLPLVLCFLIYKFQRRRMSAYDDIESYLQSDNRLTPIRYSYREIKDMTRNFRDSLGAGGYGTVYKGRVRSGYDVAVKMLKASGATGQDFVSEVSTIGRIHHANIVQLVGYCVEGSRRALVFDFMPNGSLEKYIKDAQARALLSWESKLQISLGVARGLEYLHNGCGIQILHFDIKPANILLDEKLNPKITDFGLASICASNRDTVSITVFKGTYGYIAPELVVADTRLQATSKVDVYSYGMLLLNLANLNYQLHRTNTSSSKEFPHWMYTYLSEGRDILSGLQDHDEQTRGIVMKIALVGLWCVLRNPEDRPSMSRVVEMLEGDVGNIPIPEYHDNRGESSLPPDMIAAWQSTLNADDDGEDEITISTSQD